MVGRRLPRGALQVYFLGHRRRRAASLSTAACRTSFRSESTSTRSSPRSRSRSGRSPRSASDAVTEHDLRGEGDATDLIDDIDGNEGAQQPAAQEAAQRQADKAAQQQQAAARKSKRAQGELSARNRELFALIPVALLVTAGFTAVLITNSEQLGNLSFFYGGYFLALCVATHIFIRIRLPDADPFLFPLVALLAAFGVVMLYRLDEGLARDQANWFVLGLVLFSATIIFLRDYDVLERYRYLIALVGISLLLLPRLPGIGEHDNDAYLSVDLGPLTFQPTELAKICIVVFLASYLNERREVLVVGARNVAGIVAAAARSTSARCSSSGARRWSCSSSSATSAAR